MARTLLCFLRRRAVAPVFPVLYLASSILVLAALLWFAFAITLVGLLTGDPLARSLAKGFTIYLGLGTWSLILALALIATIVTGPTSLAASAALAALCSVFALFCTTEVLNNRLGPSWLVLPAIISPAAVGLLVSGALFPRLAYIFSAPRHLWICAGAVVVLSALIMPYWIAGRRANAEATARLDLLKAQTPAAAHR